MTAYIIVNLTDKTGGTTHKSFSHALKAVQTYMKRKYKIMKITKQYAPELMCEVDRF